MDFERGFQRDGTYITMEGETITLPDDLMMLAKILSDQMNLHLFKNTKDITKRLDNPAGYTVRASRPRPNDEFKRPRS